MRFEVSGYTTDGVCFAEDAGEALPGGEGFGGCVCGGGLGGQKASVWRSVFWLRAVELRARKGKEGRTAAADREAIGGLLVGVVVLRLRDLQLWLVQVVHFVLERGGDWVVVGRFM